MQIKTYDLNSLASPEETKQFLQDMWNPKYGEGLYFSAMHELDEHMYVPIQVQGEWVYAAHAIFDGFSILQYLDKTNPALKLQYKMDTPYSPPKGFAWLAALKSALGSKPIEKHRFIHQLPYDKSLNQELRFFHLELSIDETNQLKDKNLTSLILEKVSKLCMKKLSHNTMTRWMIPVNIRGPFKGPEFSQMNASYLGLNCAIDSDPQDLKRQLVGKLKKGEQWGFWLLGKIGLFSGKKVILDQTIKSLKTEKSKWFGSFSNLGNIGGEATSPDLLIIHPVRWHRPIGCLLYVYRNKLNLTVSFHQSLDLDEKTLEDYKNEIHQSIFSK